jgi:hypothetical protein
MDRNIAPKIEKNLCFYMLVNFILEYSSDDPHAQTP